MKAAIVTGVSRGLGEALAVALVDRGYHVTGVGRSTALRPDGERYRFAACDLDDIARITALLQPVFEAIAGRQPTTICLINNAATADPIGVLGSLTADAIGTSLRVNLLAPVVIANLFCRVFGQSVRDRLVVNISSGAAQHAIAGAGTYSIAKAGLEMLTQQLVSEHGAAALRAITVRPGIIATDMQIFMRGQSRDALPSVDMFRGFHESGQLVAANVVAAKIVDRLVEAPVDQGRTYSYRDL